MVNCKEARSILWPADGLRVGDAEVESALEHAQDCDQCSEFLDEDRRVSQLIRDTVPRVCAPHELRERLYTVLARERAGAGTVSRRDHHRPMHRTAAVAGLLLAGLVLGSLGQWLAHGDRPASSATAFAEDYLRRVVEQQELESADRLQIAAFFARELGLAITPPEVPQFSVQRATICLMNGKRGGVVEYTNRNQHVTYYLVPFSEDQQSQPVPLDVQIVEEGTADPPSVASERGLGVATWWDGEHQHALVGNLTVEELRRLAPLFTGPSASL